MNDWPIPEKAASERADEFAKGQRKAFILGFKAAASEAESFRHLREWLETQRDRAEEKYQEREDNLFFTRRLAFVEVLTKLSEMGCYPEERGPE